MTASKPRHACPFLDLPPSAAARHGLRPVRRAPEGVVSGAHGELRTSVLVDPGADGRLARLDTRWQTQLPGPLQTLVLGDTFGSGGRLEPAGAFGRSAIGAQTQLAPDPRRRPALGGGPGALAGRRIGL